MTGAEVLIVVGATLLAGFVKGVTGMGHPLVAVPIVSLFLSVEEAVVLVALPNLLSNLVLCVETRASVPQTRDLPRFLAAGMPAAVAGVWVLLAVPADVLRVALAIAIFTFVFQKLRQPDLMIPPATATRFAPLAGAAAGLFQGSIGISGPIVAPWFQCYRLGQSPYIFSIAASFGATGLVQIVVLALRGGFDGRIGLAVLAIPSSLAAIWVGARVRRRLSGPVFEQLVLAVLTAAGVALVVRLVA